jgi:hypothetical protein
MRNYAKEKKISLKGCKNKAAIHERIISVETLCMPFELIVPEISLPIYDKLLE